MTTNTLLTGITQASAGLLSRRLVALGMVIRFVLGTAYLNGSRLIRNFLDAAVWSRHPRDLCRLLRAGIGLAKARAAIGGLGRSQKPEPGPPQNSSEPALTSGPEGEAPPRSNTAAHPAGKRPPAAMQNGSVPAQGSRQPASRRLPTPPPEQLSASRGIQRALAW